MTGLHIGIGAKWMRMSEQVLGFEMIQPISIDELCDLNLENATSCIEARSSTTNYSQLGRMISSIESPFRW